MTEDADNGEMVCINPTLARELADVLEHEVQHAEEHHSTEETMERGATEFRSQLAEMRN